jgi:uncharacterized protein DUF3455
MKIGNINWRPSVGGIMTIASIAALGMAFTTARPQAAHDDRITPPPVPAELRVDPPNEVFLLGHGVGTQNYVCVPSGAGVAFQLFTPEATLFSDSARQLTTHFFSPNPIESGVIRATWEDSRDTSMVWAKATNSSTDARFVNPGAVAWLRLEVTGAQAGPTGGDRLTGATFIQRLNTVGGSAPATGCTTPADIGTKAFVPYTADYFFYRDASRHDGQ